MSFLFLPEINRQDLPKNLPPSIHLFTQLEPLSTKEATKSTQSEREREREKRRNQKGSAGGWKRSCTIIRGS